MKKFSSVFSICLIISFIFGNFSLPVLASEKSSVNYEQIRTQGTFTNSKATSSNVLNEPNLNLSDEELEALKAKKLEEQSPTSKTQDKNSYLDKGLQDNSKQERLNYVPGEILIKYKNTKINLENVSGRANALNFTNSKSLENKEDLRKNNISVLKIKDTKTVEQKIAELKNDPNVEYAQPNYQYYPLAISSNDTDKANLWGLDNTGQTVNTITGTNGADIDASEAWAINEGTNTSTIVAIIDSGVAYNHPDLTSNMWDGTNCKNENGSYLGGCNHGYDFEDVDKIPLPINSSHGTHIAGTIAAVKNNNKGIIGVAPTAKIMALKTSYSTADNIKSINFAKENGAKIINASWGDSFSDATGAYIHYFLDQALYNAIRDFPGLFIAAAGNDGQNHDSGNLDTMMYPAGFRVSSTAGPGLDNIIVVAATDSDDNLAIFRDALGNPTKGSDYGTSSVDVGAPGGSGYKNGVYHGKETIYSTVADSIFLDETFEEVTPPNVPSGWIKGGAGNNWGTYDFNPSKVLYGDLAYPYANNANTTVTSPAYNLAGNTSGATIDFWTRCDTEYTGYYSGQIIYDYMVLEYSSDGVNFNEIERWDEPYLDYLNGDSSDVGGAVYNFALSIPSQYLTSNFKLRFHWVTDSSLNNYDGCWIDEVKITKYSDGSDEKYDYYFGTSMAAPHVAGLAALIEGYNPNLTTAQVKNIILTTGDNKASLSGKTVSGKRINAYNALLASNPAKAITTFTVPSQTGTTTINETAHTIALTVPFGTVVTALVPTIVITGASVSPASGVANNFTSPATYTVTAADGSTQAYVVTVTVAGATGYTISGTIKYYDSIKTVSSTTVILEDNIGTQLATTTTNASGTYQFTGVASGGNYVVRASKSDNASGLSSADQIKIGRHIVGLEPFSTIYKTIAGDVNNSGGLSSADQIKIGRFIVGLDNNLISGAWKFYSSAATLNVTNYLITGLTRVYTNLIADASNQDFVGVKMGDVNNSWVNN